MGKQSEDLEFVIDLLVNLGKFMVLFHVLICKLEQLSSSQGYSGPVRLFNLGIIGRGRG